MARGGGGHCFSWIEPLTDGAGSRGIRQDSGVRIYYSLVTRFKDSVHIMLRVRSDFIKILLRFYYMSVKMVVGDGHPPFLMRIHLILLRSYEDTA